jgi:hypothetical protein
MPKTLIEIQEYLGDTLEVTYSIKDSFSDSTEDITLHKLFPDGTREEEKWPKDDLIADYITLKTNVMGHTNKILITSLSAADKAFFEDTKLKLPKCTEFISKVPLQHTPAINDAREEERECPICKNDLFGKNPHGNDENVDVVMLTSEQGCGHKFHKECIDEWLKKNKKCPLCRNVVNSEIYVEKPLTFGGRKNRRKTKTKTKKHLLKKRKTLKKRKSVKKRKHM